MGVHSDLWLFQLSRLGWGRYGLDDKTARVLFVLVHLSRRLKYTIVIMRCPSSVRLSVRPSVVNFLYFRLLWNCWTELNETLQKVGSQRFLPSLCFAGRSEKQDGRPDLWLAETLSTSLQPLNGIQRNLTRSNNSTSSTKLTFFGPIRKTRWLSCPICQ